MTKTVATRYDVDDKEIKEFDVLKNVATHEIVIVEYGRNEAGVVGLGVLNEILGISDWLDVYPDHAFKILGNATDTLGPNLQPEKVE